MASRPAPFLRSRTAIQTVCALLLLLTAACNEDGVSHPSTTLDWKRVGVSPAEASIGDTVQVSWDYIGASGLKAQSGDILTTGGLPGVFADIASITWHVPFRLCVARRCPTR